MIVDAITAKTQQLRAKYEARGFEVIERPGPEEFPFPVGYRGAYRPALLAHRGDEHHVVEVRDPDRMSTSQLEQRIREVSGHRGWGFYLVSLDDVIPFDAPGTRDEPPPWPQLEQGAQEAVQLASAEPSPLALLALWAALEGVLRKIAIENGIPVDRLPASLLINALYDRGFIPFDSYEPLGKALEVHRRVLHGYDAPEDRLAQAVHDVMEVLPQLFADHLQHA